VIILLTHLTPPNPSRDGNIPGGAGSMYFPPYQRGGGESIKYLGFLNFNDFRPPRWSPKLQLWQPGGLTKFKH